MPFSPGLAVFGYPGSTDEKSFNRKAVASFRGEWNKGATALRLGINQNLLPPG